MQRTVLSESNGSCRLSQFDCTVMAAVSGPSPNVSFNQALSDSTYLRVFVRSPMISNEKSDFERSLEVLLKNVLTSCVDLKQYPRTKLNISVLLMSMKVKNYYKLQACAFNAVFLALIDGGLPLTCFPVAVASATGFIIANSEEDNCITVETDDIEEVDSLLLEREKIQEQLKEKLKKSFI